MKKNSINKYLLVAFCLLQGLGAKAQTLKSATFNVEPWNLYSLLGNQIDAITNLTLTGSINGYDIRAIREMDNLSVLDLSNVKLVAGSNFYVNSDISVENDKIPGYMFYNLNKLTTLMLPNSVTSIGNQALQECTALTSVVIGSSVTSIGSFAFGNCSGLTSITIPSSVTTIGNQAFWSCTGLTSFTIPGNVTSIGDNAFDICTKLKTFTVADANPNYSSYEGVLFNKDKSVLIAYPNSKSSIYTIPSSVKTIGNNAFGSCYGLANVVIGNNVTSMGTGAFYNCNGLVSVSIGSGITAIGNDVFHNCYNLSSITIPDNVTTIGQNAFGYCTGLTSVNLGKGITSIDINAFTNCNGLTVLTIPGRVTSMGDWALSYCSGLKELHCKALTPPTVTSSTFYDIDKTSCKLYVPIGTAAKYKGAAGWSEFKTVIEEVGTSISQTEISSIKVYKDQDAVVIEGANTGDRIAVYSVSGSMLQSFKSTEEVTRIYLPVNHLYIINISGRSYKVAL